MPAPDLTIRGARLHDVERLLELYRLLDVGTEDEQSIAAAQARFLDLTSNPGHRVFVALLAERIVGTFALILVGGLAHGGRHSCIVEDVVVTPDMQGHGIGRRMMRFAMQQCAAERCYKLVLSSHLQRAQAHRFYENLDFRRHGYSFLIDPGAADIARA